MKRRLFAFLLALCLILNMASGIAFADGEAEHGHTEGAQVVKTPATCTEEGVWETYCTVCNEFMNTGAISALGHEAETQKCQNDKVDPTCTEAGHDWTHCARCKSLIAQDKNGVYEAVKEDDGRVVIPATGHKFVHTDAVEPDCETAGHSAYDQCSVCGAYEKGHERVDTPALGHRDLEPADYDSIEWEQYDAEKHVANSIDAICGICGEVVEQKIDIAEPHDFGTVIYGGVAPTCTEPGYADYQVCSDCGEIKGKAEIPAKGHTYEWRGALSGSSCTEPGRVAGYYCSVCDAPEKAEQLLPAPGHDYQIVPAKAPTCTETGLTAGEKCTKCGDVKVAQEIVPATGHSYEDGLFVPGTKATCTEPGVGAHRLCDVCGEKEYLDPDQAYIPPHGHSNEDGYYPENLAYAPVAKFNTVRDYETDGIADYWQEEGEEDIAPYCESTGYIYAHKCTFCNATLNAEEIGVRPALGHYWSMMEPGKMPTCDSTGVSDLWNCLRCTKTEGGEKINALGHKMVVVEEKDPTCYEDGNFGYEYCTECGWAHNKNFAAVDAKVAELKDDSMGIVVDTVEVQEAKMPEDGSHPAVFVSEKYEQGENEPHKWTEDVVAVAPTCTENGVKEGAKRCLECGKLFGLTVLPANGHEPAFVPGEAANCVDAGNEPFAICAVCGKIAVGVKFSFSIDFEELDEKLTASEITGSFIDVMNGNLPAEVVIPAWGHTEEPGLELAPTCTTPGHTAGLYCSVCKITLEAHKEVPALGHDEYEVEPAVEATCTTKGKTAVIGCTRCDYTTGGVEGTALGHDGGARTAVVPATCYEVGFTAGMHCTKCKVDYDAVYGYLTENGIISKADLYDAGWIVVPELIPARDHKKADGTSNMSTPVTENPTCTEEGYLNYSECQYEDCEYFTGSIREPLGHVWLQVPGGVGTAMAPTCEKAGTTGNIEQCARCRETQAESAPALGHDWVKVEFKDATCKEAGNIAYEQCSRCDLYLVDGKEYTEFVVELAKHETHDNLMHVPALMATCKTAGHTDGQYCDVCGYNNFTEIAPDAAAYHQYLKDNMDALVAEGKLEWVTTAPFDENVPGSGMVSVLCPDCGYIVAVKLWPEVQMGDVNMDGFVDVVDALMILQYEAGVIKSLPNEKAANFYVDEFIDSLDALAILNSLVGN